MKVLVLGATGMLGHKLIQQFTACFDTFGTVRSAPDEGVSSRLFNPRNVLPRVTAEDFDSVVRAIGTVRPDVVVNCIGITKHVRGSGDPIASICVNTVFPHRLAELCGLAGARMIHISTDCVFSGQKGNYAETDPCDASDLYGRSKALGEVDTEGVLTVRTSIIGHELGTRRGLLEWFLSHANESVRGYRRAIFSGYPSCVLAETLARVIIEFPRLHGIWHVASEPINKFDLLRLVNQTYDAKVCIAPDDHFVCDRSLNGERFWQATGIVAPPWPELIERMHQDSLQH